nr:ATP cone domain-containing protein [Candidatus Cloacimonadota bacterium]
MFQFIRKRDNQIVKFEAEKITQAILKAGEATQEFDITIARKLSLQVINLAQQVIEKQVPSVEQIQDIVEEVLLSSPFKKST